MLGASVVYKFLETHFIASLMKLDQVYIAYVIDLMVAFSVKSNV
uniref:Uncharacterized protein n=1 Tax=Anguilla anguilla TaxID=7936 RepID=A0A0E9RR29_ANGAN